MMILGSLLFVTLLCGCAVAQTGSGTSSATSPSGKEQQDAEATSPRPADTPATPQEAAPPGAAKGDAAAADKPESDVDAAAGNGPATIRTDVKTEAAGEVNLEALMPPKPELKGKVSLIGGTIESLDKIRHRMVVKPFGQGKKMKVIFDDRTPVTRDGNESNAMQLRKGDRVYLDTQLAGPRIFAKTINVANEIRPADARGQVTRFNAKEGLLTIQDQLSGSPVSFRVGPNTGIRRANANGTQADLRPGSLIEVTFAPGGKDRGAAQQIAVLAVPGSTFTFYGKVTHLDLRSGVLAVENESDGKTYEIVSSPERLKNMPDLQVGSRVSIQATFSGRDYAARTISVVSAAEQEQASK